MVKNIRIRYSTQEVINIFSKTFTLMSCIIFVPMKHNNCNTSRTASKQNNEFYHVIGILKLELRVITRKFAA